MPYTVKKGDTLSKIASSLGLGGWQKLYELNKSTIGSNPDLIKPGQVLTLPDEAGAAGGETPPEDGGGKKSDPAGVMAGGKTIKVKGADGTDRYYEIYEFPAGSGNYVSYQYNNLEQLNLAKTGDKSEVPGFQTVTEDWFNNQVMAQGAAEEIVGKKGTFSGMMQKVMAEAAAKAGVHDPTLAGQMASNKEMQEVMAQAVVGDWTSEQIKAAQRNTSFWKDTLYPGIENLYTMTSEPERAYADYMNQVAPALRSLGYEPGADGTFKSTIATMLDSKIDSNVFMSQVPTFIRATQNAEFASVLNEWAERDLGKDIDFNDWLT